MSTPALFPTGGLARWLAAGSLLAALSGCVLPNAQQGPGSGVVISQGQSGTPLDANLSGFLEQAPPGAVTDLPTSPWGPNVVVSAEAPYPAASGRICRHVRVDTAHGPVSPQVACKGAQGWEARRLVTEVRTGGAR
ncbi:MAG: hypothetical protein HLX48_10305 [Halomonas sp.]|uniref:DVU3141 family protein n=1 Tax=Halomonas sp. TaxID=1486246 RepID=UPI0017913A33|nr:DVU3141 family protein [Halomonas sp.]NWN83360.1 hypothetical protein [Halomonas sp.]